MRNPESCVSILNEVGEGERLSVQLAKVVYRPTLKLRAQVGRRAASRWDAQPGFWVPVPNLRQPSHSTDDAGRLSFSSGGPRAAPAALSSRSAPIDSTAIRSYLDAPLHPLRQFGHRASRNDAATHV